MSQISRNHPELDWRVATTEHFEIAYPARLDSIAARAAPIAETTYDSLSASLGVTFDERIRVYLTDQDGLPFGFATSLGYANIWVHPNDWTRQISNDTVPYLRLVLSHELAHVFHYRATEGDFGTLGRLVEGVPRSWAEGLAQYETETWNAQRGERWLRAAVLGGDLDDEDGESLWNGRLLYASGHSRMRYFAQQHGDSTLTDLIHHKKDVLFGLAEVHDFEAAFEKTAGLAYEDFREQWRRDVNAYYNTLATQLETLDSLRTDTLHTPGRYVKDLAYSPDRSMIAALVAMSPERPGRRLYVMNRSSRERRVVAKGLIESPVAWHPSGEKIAFSRMCHGPEGALADDLFLVGTDGGEPRRLTHGRRTTAPTFGPGGERLAFAATRDGVTNVHVLTLSTGTTTPVTSYEANVEIEDVAWHPSRDTLALAHIGAKGRRTVRLHDMSADSSVVLTDAATDDRKLAWSPGGEKLAYTSFRDGVPNAFVYDLQASSHRRVTNLVRGAIAHDWAPADSGLVAGDSVSTQALAVSTTLSKENDKAFRIPASRTAPDTEPSVPGAYGDWTRIQPPSPIPTSIAPDGSLIQTRRDYEPLANLAHALTLGLPFYSEESGPGVIGSTVWQTPLEKHLFSAGGYLSFTQPAESQVLLSYRNRQFTPTIGVDLFSATSSARIYGSDLLLEQQRGGQLSARWPIDWGAEPYTSTTLGGRLRYVDIEPLDREAFTPALGELRPPQAGQQATATLQVLRRKRPPNRHALVHPLDGWGLRAAVTGAADVLGGDSSFLRADLAGYQILPGAGALTGDPSLSSPSPAKEHLQKHRLFLYGRLQAQTGSSFPQDYIGFSRYDAIELSSLPGATGGVFEVASPDRVRGYRSYALGTRVAFGSAEYRLPLLPSLQTRVLGAVELGKTTLSAFVDGGAVWTGTDLGGATHRVGTGVELKNEVKIGPLRIGHAVGTARPALEGGLERWKVYYRVQTALPF